MAKDPKKNPAKKKSTKKTTKKTTQKKTTSSRKMTTKRQKPRKIPPKTQQKREGWEDLILKAKNPGDLVVMKIRKEHGETEYVDHQVYTPTKYPDHMGIKRAAGVDLDKNEFEFTEDGVHDKKRRELITTPTHLKPKPSLWDRLKKKFKKSNS